MKTMTGKNEKSGFGNVPEDPYLVFESNKGLRGKQQTSCFVLRFAREKAAFEALRYFLNLLEADDPRADSLRNFLDRNKNIFS